MLAGLMSPLFLIELGDDSLADRLAIGPDMGAWNLIAGHSGPRGVALFGMAYMLTLGAIGYGLWGLKEWARRTVIGLAVLSLLWSFWSISNDPSHGTFNGGNIVVLVLFSLMVYYFQRPPVKHSFS